MLICMEYTEWAHLDGHFIQCILLTKDFLNLLRFCKSIKVRGIERILANLGGMEGNCIRFHRALRLEIRDFLEFF